MPHKDQRSYHGVRQRSWGKWVSEIRLPKNRSRIWLGSYHTQEAAARAHDTALAYLRGPSARLNFPHSPPHVPLCDTYPAASPKSIQRAALEEGSKFDKQLHAQAGASSSGIDDDADKQAIAAVAQRKSFDCEQQESNGCARTPFLCRQVDAESAATVPYLQDQPKQFRDLQTPACCGILSASCEESKAAFSEQNVEHEQKKVIRIPFSSPLVAQPISMTAAAAAPSIDFSRCTSFCLLPKAGDLHPWLPNTDELCD